MRLSLIIPTRNRPSLLREALRSLLRQTYPFFEAVVVDDGEGEGLEVAQGLGDPRIRALPQPGRGQVEARRAGLRAARALRRGGLVYSGGVFLLPHEELPYEPGPIGEGLLRDNPILASGSGLLRKDLEDLGGLDPGMGHYWDWDLWLRAYRAGLPFRYLKGPNVGIRVHGGNQSYGAHLEERRRDLEALRAKHGLGPLVLKDHLRLHRELRAQGLSP
ncbi:glycosyl transferase family 2 [Thermus scotoductus]|uniref:Glycosyl transferase family 2 n=3 Tax=Thermus scotoductus TaxID=37636 RepID=A0A430S196_THESC|nr:glycosyltransferase family A protein [Thermus scotoductus]RTH27369.1 glycosyl transferase family 2 [Thermus scotoductus]RTI02340.1 glycosyl transferase family 2 [Thermus scotoductus]